MSTKERQPKTACPYCDHWDSKVMQGWGDPLARYYLRRRKCLACLKTFHTEERVLETNATTGRKASRVSNA